MPAGMGIQIHSGDAPVVLRGQLVEQVLGFLEGVLDGRRTLEELQASLPADLPVEAVARTLRILHTKGLLADGAQGHTARLAPQPANDPVVERQLLNVGTPYR